MDKRKPNWSTDDLEALAQGVSTNIKTIRGAFSPGLTNSQKTQCWQQIAERVHPQSNYTCVLIFLHFVTRMMARIGGKVLGHGVPKEISLPWHHNGVTKNANGLIDEKCRTGSSCIAGRYLGSDFY
uniref:Myb/SANT-like DNA-binding domain-containing protein n=1 Tax=Magallana gigas TaxID=29159 RepID=K1R3F1_MAGGI